MGYHVNPEWFEELPKRIVVREDGWLSKQAGEEVVQKEYVYVPDIPEEGRDEGKLHVKEYVLWGCEFIGKGIVGRPEMGVISRCKRVTFDRWDLMRGEWLGKETHRLMYLTDTGYSFDETDLKEGRLEIEPYAENWRAHKGTPWP